MRNIFSINGTGILTLKDLQREFSPWDIYSTLADFVSFASIHSQPLPIKLSYKDDNGLTWEDATYFNKDFWIALLNVRDWSQEPNAVKLMNMFIEEIALVNSGAKDSFAKDKNIGIDTGKKKDKCIDYNKEKTAIIAEYKALCIEKKLQHIVKTARLNDSPQNSRISIVLLAICELSEVNTLDYSFSKIESKETLSNDNPYGTKDTKASAISANNQATEEDSHISEFPSTNDISLLTRDIPYKYWYHSSNKLEPGEIIKTVCVRAKAGSNKYAPVIIQLYDDVSNKCVHTLTLASNEYRYCNVAGGKIIKFLPTISMSPDTYLCRSDLTKSAISVCVEGATEWTLDENNIASFGVANNNDGFVLVQNSKLNTVFYKKANDYITKMMMSLIVDPVVEIQLTENGYKVLTSKGETFSNIPSYTPEQKIISLDDYSRYPIPKTNLSQSDEITEISLGYTRDCIMLRSKNSKKNIVLFRSGRKHIHIHRDTQNGLKLLVE